MLRVCFLLIASVLASGPAFAQSLKTTVAPAGVLRIYIARHGETAANAERRVVGQMDVPLNRRGREQSVALKNALRGVSLDALYSSPLSRCLATADIVADGQSIRVLDLLRERHQGRFQGLLATAPGFIERSADPRDDLDGGETMEQVADRARMALSVIRRAHSSGSVAVIGHALMNQMLLRSLLDLPMARAMRIGQANDELYLVELRRSQPPLVLKLIQDIRLGDL